MTPSSVVVICYLMGAVPYGLIVTWLFNRIDLREYGSGNIGASNVLRTSGAWAGAAVLVLDVGKGLLAVTLARTIDHSPSLEVAAAIAVLVGHSWSVFLRLKGGKGVATSIGALWALSPLAGLLVMLVGLPFLAYFRYVSLGSIIGALTALVSMLLLGMLGPSVPFGVPSLTYVIYTLFGTPIILLKHRENIMRLLRGQERKLGDAVIAEDTSPKVSG